MDERSGHRARQRSKLREFGLSAMQDYEILEVLLFYAIPRCDTKPMAHRLMRRFGSLYGVLTASEEELCGVEGVGPSAALLLSLFRPLWQRTTLAALDECILDTPARVGAYFCGMLRDATQEQLYAAALDAKGKLLVCRHLCEGDEVLDPLTLSRFANGIGASHIVLAQTRLGGMIASKSDLDAAHTAAQALAPYDINLSDYVVICGDRYVSLLHTDVAKQAR